jgi:hypothetical protein
VRADEAQLPPLSDVGLMCRQQAVYRRQAARRALVSRYQRFDHFVQSTRAEAERLAAAGGRTPQQQRHATMPLTSQSGPSSCTATAAHHHHTAHSLGNRSRSASAEHGVAEGGTPSGATATTASSLGNSSHITVQNSGSGSSSSALTSVATNTTTNTTANANAAVTTTNSAEAAIRNSNLMGATTIRNSWQRSESAGRNSCALSLLDEEMRERRAEQLLVAETLRRRPSAADRVSILLQRGWLDSVLRERDHTQQAQEVARWRAEHAAQFRAEFERMRAQRLRTHSVLHMIPHGWPPQVQEEQHRQLGEYVSRRRHQTERGLRTDLDQLTVQVAAMDQRMDQVHQHINEQPSPLPALVFDDTMEVHPALHSHEWTARRRTVYTPSARHLTSHYAADDLLAVTHSTVRPSSNC